jgi:hypothetical protein
MYTHLLSYLLTYSMEQSPAWEANWSAASQEISHILWNPKDHHRTLKRTPPVLILSIRCGNRWELLQQAKVFLQQVACDSMGLCWCRAEIGETCLEPFADSSAEILLAIIKACFLPSTTIISDCCGYNVRLFHEGLTHHTVDCSVLWATGAYANTIEPTWKHIRVYLMSYWENEIKCVINGFKCSLSAEFDHISEWNVKRCV